MKRLLLPLLYFIFLATTASAQQFSVRGGLDLGHKYNLPPTVKMPLAGFNGGFSADKYWSFWGIGIDVDVYANKAARYDSTGLSASAAPWVVKDFTRSSSRMQRYFVGIGPSFRVQDKRHKLVAELNLRGGISYADGSAIKADAVFTDPGGSLNMSMFNHAGYSKKFLGAAKAQVKVNYYFTPKWGVNAGAYYIYHINSEEPYSYSEIIALPNNVNYVKDITSVSSYGVFAGVSYRILPKKKKNKVSAVSTPAVFKDIAVYVKDELTGQPLPNALVVMTDTTGKATEVSTDKNGLALFPNTIPAAYAIQASLHDIATTSDNISRKQYRTEGNITLTLTHNDPRFTLVGKAINKTSGDAEGDVSVTLTNETKSSIRQSSSKTGSGEFRFQLDAGADFNVVGKKKNYLSNIEKITTKGLNRSQALYVQLELGVEEALEGKQIKLDNIYYDLNRSDLRPDASTDLQKLIVFMQDNPSLRIELSSHTDARGSEIHNLKLSQARAQSVVSYLIRNGVSKDRMVAKGYGETKPVNTCTDCSEAEHQQNRRTEIKVL
ncbi:OmpA family protein [Chitinophaga sp. SYP-B3965]|uniref:OmpA family protein n=1 Tax=Chitinophaga sp. SYP-B3965 TaxID=2663120 RepID=UPI0012995095|nr:OmpA family protein [Chitinophaga sp. SYP-B3965]MRG45160.1 OmpA family protein [Chitinophaga sp. SYP-B3965]